MLSAHRGKSQGRPRTTSSSQLIGHIGLPVRVSHQRPVSRKHECSRRGRTGSSCPDNAWDYARSRLFRELLTHHGIRHLKTKPYCPRTNGKVERFHQTMTREWAYGLVYSSHRDRADALPHWLDQYNTRRPHSSLGGLPPISRVHNVRRQDI